MVSDDLGPCGDCGEPAVEILGESILCARCATKLWLAYETACWISDNRGWTWEPLHLALGWLPDLATRRGL